MFDPAQIGSPLLRELYDYWRRKGRDGRLPSRSDIDPIEIPRLLRFLALLRVVGDAEDFEFQLAGTGIEDVYGRSLKGVAISTLGPDLDPPPLILQYVEVTRTALPLYREETLADIGKPHWHVRRLVLPLAQDGAHVDTILVGASYRPISMVADDPEPLAC